jgi:hypothetical protein
VLALLATLLLPLVAAVAERAHARGKPTTAATAGCAGGASDVDLDVRTRASLQPAPLRDVLFSAPATPVVVARRVAALVNLLESLHELRDSRARGDGDGYRDAGLLLTAHEPSCWLHRDGRTCTCVQSGVAEIERLLAEMRRREPHLRWHVMSYFVDARSRGRWEPRRPRRKRHYAPFVYRRWVERSPAASREQAMLGVAWLAERWNLRDVRGELVEPWLVSPGFDKRTFERLGSGHSGVLRPKTA